MSSVLNEKVFCVIEEPFFLERINISAGHSPKAPFACAGFMFIGFDSLFSELSVSRYRGSFLVGDVGHACLSSNRG